MSNKRKRYRIKPKGRDTKFKRLKALGCFQEVHKMILEGHSMPDVALFIQETRQEYTDVTRASLIQTLNKYRKTIPPAELASVRIPSVIQKAAHEVEDGLDALKALEELYRIQMDRVGLDYRTERRIGKLMPTMTQEMRAAREILNTYAQLQMDLGLSQRHLGQLNVDTTIKSALERYGNESVAKVVSDPQSRRKVLGLAERFISITGRRDDIDDIIDIDPDDVEEDE